MENLRFHGDIDLIPDFVYRDSRDIFFNSEEFHVLFTGALSIGVKGIDLLARVIRATLEKESGIKFFIAGPPSDGKEIIKEIAEMYPHNVLYMGFVSEAELTVLHEDSSLFVFTSRVDSFSLGIVWAQSYGLPCVAFDIPGQRDIIMSAGQGSLVETFNVDNFASEIIKFYSLWHKNRSEYFSLRLEIQRKIYDRLGRNIILPKMINMLCNNSNSFQTKSELHPSL